MRRIARANPSDFLDDFDAATVPCPVGWRTSRMFPDVPVSIILGDETTYVTINYLAAHPGTRATGAGTEAMRRILDLADKHGLTIFLDSVPLDEGWSWERLRKWYMSFGFVYDVEDGSMMRLPHAKGTRRPNPRRRNPSVFDTLSPGTPNAVREQLQRLSRDDLARLQDELNALDDASTSRFVGMTRLYHGAPSSIAEAIRERGFALTKGRRSGFLGGTHEVDNLALFLTENRALAEAFGANRTDRYGENGEVLEVYADLRQPLDMTTWTKVPKPIRMLGEALLGQKRPKQEDLFWLVDQPAFVTAVRDLGYDAIRFTESAETVKALGLGRKGEITVAVLDPTRLHVAPPTRGSLGSLLWHLEHTEPPMMRRRNPRNPQTETSASSAAFRRWFGKSKVVDAEGSPRVVYHGTAYAPGQPPITEFRGPHQPYRYPAFTGGKIVGVGSFFSESEEVAASYPYLFLPETQNYARVVHTLYLRIERPKVYRTVRAAAADMIARTRAERLVHGKETGDPVAFVALLRAEGYDGITFMEGPSYNPTDAKKKARVWVAFDPRQVKSATDNAGTFDPADPSTLRNPRRNGRGGTAADRTDPDLWEAVKREVTAGNKGGKPGQWSARKAQLSVALYQQRGGGYYGPKDPRNSLAKWTREKWRTKSGRPSLETGERYLPTKAIAALTDAEYAATTRAKRAGMRKGQQFVAQPEDVAAKTARYRRNTGYAPLRWEDGDDEDDLDFEATGHLTDAVSAILHGMELTGQGKPSASEVSSVLQREGVSPHARALYLHSISVSPGLRRTGEGRRYVSYIENDVRRRGVEVVVGHADHSLGFWQKQGYTLWSHPPAERPEMSAIMYKVLGRTNPARRAGEKAQRANPARRAGDKRYRKNRR